MPTPGANKMHRPPTTRPVMTTGTLARGNAAPPPPPPPSPPPLPPPPPTPPPPAAAVASQTATVQKHSTNGDGPLVVTFAAAAPRAEVAGTGVASTASGLVRPLGAWGAPVWANVSTAAGAHASEPVLRRFQGTSSATTTALTALYRHFVALSASVAEIGCGRFVTTAATASWTAATLRRRDHGYCTQRCLVNAFTDAASGTVPAHVGSCDLVSSGDSADTWIGAVQAALAPLGAASHRLDVAADDVELARRAAAALFPVASSVGLADASSRTQAMHARPTGAWMLLVAHSPECQLVLAQRHPAVSQLFEAFASAPVASRELQCEHREIDAWRMTSGTACMAGLEATAPARAVLSLPALRRMLASRGGDGVGVVPHVVSEDQLTSFIGTVGYAHATSTASVTFAEFQILLVFLADRCGAANVGRSVDATAADVAHRLEHLITYLTAA